MGDPLYAQEKLGIAVRELATRPETIKKRLEEAAFQISLLNERHFPDHLKDDYTWIDESLTAKPAHGNEGTIVATLASMSVGQVQEIAMRIYDLDYKLLVYNCDDATS